jgi:hypothetical protein
MQALQRLLLDGFDPDGLNIRAACGLMRASLLASAHTACHPAHPARALISLGHLTFT